MAEEMATVQAGWNMAGEPITTADWSTPARPNPLADFRAVASFFADHGMPVAPSPVALVTSELFDLLTGKPRSADLTADPLACAILRQWARQPWQMAHRVALVDRMLEKGYGEPEVSWARACPAFWYGDVGTWQSASRSWRRGTVRAWTRRLVEQFGDFEAKPLPGGTEDTPQGG